MSEAQRTTIVGVATGTPDGGVAMVRLSGPSAQALASALVGPMPRPRRLARRALALGPGRGTEDALVVSMPAPASLTGEDVVELHVHAGVRNVTEIVDALLARGAVAAGPGEFSRRAFDHGRLSLDQAEGIAALVGARTDAALAQARRLVAGELGREVTALRERLVDLRCELEAHLDFPDDVGDDDVRRWRGEVVTLHATIADWLARFAAGKRARAQARVVLAGPPNAGKSSLFNALLGRARAIVSTQPGTTRDYVEASLELPGVSAVLVDTAGLREGQDGIEAGGIARSKEQIAGAELTIWIEEPTSRPRRRRAGRAAPSRTSATSGGQRPAFFGVSARTGEGLAELRAVVGGAPARRRGPWIGLARHHGTQEGGRVAAQASALLVDADAPLELAAFELAVAERRLGEITGVSATGPIGEALLDRIFARFCIGK
ncbi:MAG: GTPase [Nannocystaceae bacterium]